MERIVEQGLLYDFYGELLTDHQKQVYGNAVYNDLSLSEIADEMGISRQGVHDLMKRCNRILEEYERKLHLLEKFAVTKRKVKEINGIAEELTKAEVMGAAGDCADRKEHLLQEIDRIRQLSNEIIEEL